MNKPHVLLITCDEMRLDTIGCYGGKAVKTPHIDSLAERGTRFDNAYTVSPVCLPARCSILTGLYPHHSGAYSNFRKCALDGGIPNLFNQLHLGGYKNGMIGKCHFAPVPYSQTRADVTLPYDEFKDYYVSLGIDELILQDDKQVSVWFYDDYSKALDKEGYLKPYRDTLWDKSNRKVFPFPAPDAWHPDAWVGNQAADYIEKLDADNPSFTWVSFSGPHYPFDTPASYQSRVDESALPGKDIMPGELDSESRIHHESYYGKGRIDGCHAAEGRACVNYTDEYWLELQKQYYANVALIDDKVGDILSKARERFGDNLLVVFTVDHGEMLGHHGLWGKHDCAYDDVWHIPFIAAGPGFGNEPSAAKVNSNDIMPTFLNAAGIPLPPVDGRDLKAQMKTGGYEYLFCESEGFIAITDGRFKYIHVQDGRVVDELLDTQTDPGERVNQLSNKAYASDLARLTMKMVEHMMDKVLP
jgi:Arylsulfatase A and related enzymes